MSSSEHPEQVSPAATVAPAPVLPEDPVWRGTDVVVIVLVALIAIVAFSAVGLGIVRLALGPAIDMTALSHDARLLVPVQAAAYAVVVLFMVALVTQHYGRRFGEAVRWNWPHGKALGLITAGAGLAFVVELLSTWLPVPPQLPIDEYFNTMGSAYSMAAFGIALAPLVEELFFRGFLYPVLARRIGVGAGVVLTSLGFALIHESQLAHAWAPLLLLFGVGVVLTLARVLLKSVAAPVLVHVGYNFTLFCMVWFATDHFRHLERLGK